MKHLQCNKLKSAIYVTVSVHLISNACLAERVHVGEELEYVRHVRAHHFRRGRRVERRVGRRDGRPGRDAPAARGRSGTARRGTAEDGFELELQLWSGLFNLPSCSKLEYEISVNFMIANRRNSHI